MKNSLLILQSLIVFSLKIHGSQEDGRKYMQGLIRFYGSNSVANMKPAEIERARAQVGEPTENPGRISAQDRFSGASRTETLSPTMQLMDTNQILIDELHGMMEDYVKFFIQVRSMQQNGPGLAGVPNVEQANSAMIGMDTRCAQLLSNMQQIKASYSDRSKQ